MRKVKVLFFTADPSLGRPDGIPLELAEDLRQIKKHVAQARYGHRLDFEPHGAARADDLIDVLENTDAQVLHFSGHGGKHGLVFVATDGCSTHPVDAAALKQLFRTYHGTVRLAVLSACTSRAEAQAIADIVGCALGTLTKIGDEAAINFNGRFYRAIANGHSVQRAWKEACTALQVHRVSEPEYPQVFVRDGVDPSDLVLVKTYRPVPRRLAAAAIPCVLTATAVAWPPAVTPELTVSDIACGTASAGRSVRAAVSASPADPDGPAEKLADAKAFYGARKYAAAAQAFEEVAEEGNGEAMGCLGYMYLYGRGMQAQPPTGFEWVHRGATKERDPHAMYALANAYLGGLGTEAREHLARYWFAEAAELGYAEAMRSLGDLARQRTSDSTHQQALVWYWKARDAGAVNARVDIGLMYEFGWGVKRDPAVALKWYQSAAREESPRGMFAVGQCYHKGVGVAVDYRAAMTWYLKAARAGSADAMNSIGVLYDNGLGVRKSHAKARRWYRRAEKAGSTLAKGNLGSFGRD